MTSGFSGNFIHNGGGGDGGARLPMAAIAGTQGGVFPYGLGQQQLQPSQQQQLQSSQQQQQQLGSFSTDQITQRREDLLMGKRSFSDFQSYQQQQQPPPQFRQLFPSQQQQQQPISVFQHQYLMRSLKQKTNHLNNLNAFSSPRFGVPLYQQQQQQPVSLVNNHPQNFNLPNNLNSLASNHNGGNLFNGNLVDGLSNSTQNNKILDTLQQLENHLLNDDDDDDTTNLDEPDPVSGITNSEWSDTFHNLIGPGPNPSPNPAQNPIPGSSSTSSSNTTTTNNNNNNMISASPTSSTSSCCSTSASPATPPPVSVNQLISDATTAISDGKMDAAKETLIHLSKVSNPNGNSEQRLGHYMAYALRSRACPNENPPPLIELYGKQHVSAMCCLHELSPCFKFGVLAANLVMLEAMASALQEGLKIHVVDFHIGNGGQYMNLIRALGQRGCKSLRFSLVEITELSGNLILETSVEESLVNLAAKVGINLSFERMNLRMTELTRESLSCEDGEAIVVNFAYWLYRAPDESVSIVNLRDELLRRVKGLSPRAVTLIEQDLNANTAPFATRVNEACGYYGALFDALESSFPRGDPDRVRIEEGLGQKMANAIACEGRQRVERTEVFGKWRARMGMAGFELKPMNQTVAESMRVKLNSVRGGNPGFTVKDENGGIGIGWKERTITVASAWR